MKGRKKTKRYNENGSYLRKTIDIKKESFEFLRFIAKERNYKALKYLIEDILNNYCNNESELYELFLEKKGIDEKLQQVLKRKESD